MNILKKINRIINEGFEEGDMVKVTGNVIGKGSIGKVIDISPQGSFYIVKIGVKNHSYHESDLEIKKKVNEQETGASLTANVAKNDATATNVVAKRRINPKRELPEHQCRNGQRWDSVRKMCIPDPLTEDIKSDIELVRQVAKDQGVDEFIPDKDAIKIIRDVKKRGSKEDFYYNLKEYFYA